jgi:hypothetical protein
MNMSALRNIGFWLLMASVVVMTTASVGANLMSAWNNHQLSLDAKIDAASLMERSRQMSAQLDTLQAGRSVLSIVAADGTQAASLMQRALQQSFDAGSVLSLRVQAGENGILAAQLLWRGSEADLRSALEEMAVALPFAVYDQLNIRGVRLGDEPLVEYRVNVMQTWEISS